MPSWPRELSKRRKIERLLNSPFKRKSPKKRLIERLLRLRRRLKPKLKGFMSKN